MSDGKNPDKNLFLRSPLDLPSELKTPNGVLLPEPFSSSQAFNQEDHTSPSSSLGNGTSATDGFVDGLLKSSDHSSSNTAQAQNLSNSWDAESSDVVRNTHYGDFKENDFIQTEQHYQDSLFEPPKAFEDPFESPSNTGYDLFQSPQAAPVNPFYTSDAQKDNGFEADPNEDFFKTKEFQSKEKQLLRSTLKENVDMFPSTSTNPDDMFPSPLSRNLFQDFSSDEPLNHTPSKPQSLQRDALDDIFLPYPSEDKENRNTFATASSEGPSPLTHSITRVPPPLPKKVPPPLLPKPLQRPNKLVLTTPQGTKLDVLKSTPLLQPRSLSPSPSSAEMTHVCSGCELQGCLGSLSIKFQFYSCDLLKSAGVDCQTSTQTAPSVQTSHARKTTTTRQTPIADDLCEFRTLLLIVFITSTSVWLGLATKCAFELSGQFRTRATNAAS